MTNPHTTGAREQSRLVRFAASEGEATTSAANQPVTLDDPSLAYLVVEGAVDVFLFEQTDGVTSSSARHILRAEAGQLLFGIGSHDTPLIAIGKGLSGARLAKLRCSSLAAREFADEFADQADRWVTAIGGAVAARIDPRPRPTLSDRSHQ